MAGFDNDVVYGSNVDFSGGNPVTGKVTSDGQLLIGSTATPHIRVGTLSSTGGTVSITNGSGTINLEAASSVATTYLEDTGSATPLANNLNVIGQKAGTIPVMDTVGSGSTISIENRTWTSKYVVDQSTTVGLRGTYSTIQSAIDDAFNNGGGEVLIRSSIFAYTENLTLRDGVNLTGISANDRVTFSSHVLIWGVHTLTGDGNVKINNIAFDSNSGGNLFTINGPDATNTSIIFTQCFVQSTSPGEKTFLVTPLLAGTINLYFYNCTGISDTNFIDAEGTGTTTLTVEDGIFSTNSDQCINFNGGTCSFTINNSNLNGATYCIQSTTTLNGQLYGTQCIAGTNEVISFIAGNSLTIQSCVMQSSAISNNWITGAGTIFWADITFPGTATLVDGAATSTPIVWGPHATSGNSGTAYKGTAGFDSTVFTVTDGFVTSSGTGIGQTITGDSGGALSPTAGNWNIVGGPGVTTSGSGSTLTINSVVFTNTAAATLAVDNGYFATAAGTYPLPATAAQGEMLIVVCDTAGAVVLDAPANNFIRVGSSITSSGGTATSNAIGDSLTLRYRLSSLTWEATSVVGTWTIA